jgi:MFS family permease
VPWTGSIGSVSLFVLCFVIIMSMYGGGFATVPAYLKDMFGTRYVGAIHGWLITAWSAAGVFGPVLVNYIREYQIDTACRRRRPTTSPCTSWRDCWSSASSATS